MNKVIPRILIVLILLTSGCDIVPIPERTPVSEETPIPLATTAELATPSGEVSTPMTLRLWIPAEFDPSVDDTAGELLLSHLREYSARNPGFQVEVRVKESTGAGGMLHSLETGKVML